MQLALIIALSLHILASVFWAGTSFTLARTGGVGGELLLRPQMGAAIVAVLAGAYLWSQLHIGALGPTEHVLGAGAACALLAAGVQGFVGGPAAGALRAGRTATGARSRMAIAQRIASGLLAVAIICMAAARYV
jgi:hypothetical protein